MPASRRSNRAILGYLVRSRVYAPSTPDLTGVRVQAGDYVENQLAERMDKQKLVADVIGSWHKWGERRRTVCFATGVPHSIHLRNEFINSGVRAEHIDGDTLKDERDATLARLASGEIEVVTNCMVLTEGWDMPEVGCCILARPTKKMGLFRQMIGRVLRPAPGKTDAIILDHSGAVFRHGLPEDRVDWFLSADLSARSPDHEARKPVTSTCCTATLQTLSGDWPCASCRKPRQDSYAMLCFACTRSPCPRCRLRTLTTERKTISGCTESPKLDDGIIRLRSDTGSVDGNGRRRWRRSDDMNQTSDIAARRCRIAGHAMPDNPGRAINYLVNPHLVRSAFDSCRADPIEGSQRLWAKKDIMQMLWCIGDCPARTIAFATAY
jgi:Helicase conserved C-terminal domain